MLSRVSLIVLIVGLVLAESAAGPSQDERALETVHRAIKAHGGAMVIAKLKMAQVKSTMKGTLPLAGDVEISVEDTFQLPAKFRKAMKGKMSGKELEITWAVNGEKCWYKENDRPVLDMTRKPDGKGEYHPFVVIESLASVADKDNELRPVKELQLDGQQLVGVEQTRDGKLQGILYFDKSTGLLARSKASTTVPLVSPDKALEIEGVFTEYKEINGLKLPMKQVVYHDGKKAMEISVLDVKLLDKVDDKLFEKPSP